jgi:hypothetical protein
MRSARIAFARWFATAFVPRFSPLVNPLIRRVLRSPLRGLVDWYVTVVRFQGVRSGKTYEVPFTFHRLARDSASGQAVECMTSRRGVWWRNLRGGVDASLLHHARWQPAWAEAIDDEAAIIAALALRDWPRRLLIPLLPADTVLVRVTLSE